MTASDIAVQIKSLRTQLDVLAAKLQAERQDQNHHFGDLHGMLAAESQSSAEEIDDVLYRTPDDTEL